jgi:hypothetical protein
MDKKPIYIIAGTGSHIGIRKIAAALAMSHHPVVIQAKKFEEQQVKERKQKELDEMNEKANKLFKDIIDTAELRMQLGELHIPTKKYIDQLDRIPVPKKYRKNRFK